MAASARLAQLLNMDPSTRLKPIDGWIVPAPIVPDPVPLQDLLAVALMQRPELAEWRAAIQEATYGLSMAKLLPFSPTVILGFSTGGFGGGSNRISTPPGFLGQNGQYQVGPRFGGFDNRVDLDVVGYWTVRNLGVGNVALNRRANSILRQTRFRELEVLNRVRAEVAEAEARTRAKFAQIEVAERAVRASTEAFQEDNADLFRRQVQQADEDAAVASARLARLLNLDPAARLRTPGGTVTPVSLIDENQELEPLVEQALRGRPEVAARGAAVGEAQVRVKQEKVRPWLPTLSVGFSGGHFGGGGDLAGYDWSRGQSRTDFDVVAY